MRTIIVIASVLVLTYRLCAQTDITSLDRLNYQYFLGKDYKNLKRTANEILNQGNDYYYLRMRLGILAYENQRYAFAYRNFTRAKQQNPFDTVTNEYLYYCYLLAGRQADALQFFRTLSEKDKNSHLKSLPMAKAPELILSYSYTGYDIKKYQTNPLNFEAIEYVAVLNAGLAFNFSERANGFFQYSNTSKVATFYSPSEPSGNYDTYKQNQFYFSYKNLISQGFEFSGFTHWVFFTDVSNVSTYGRRSSSLNLSTESLFGLNFTLIGWYLRGGINFNYSNFANSSQFATEAYITYLPFSNLNLYSTVSGFYQLDKNWGGTYQSNFDIGFKVFKYLWVESGMMIGNSFLYSRNFGTELNNSFIIPSKSFYGSLVIPAKKFSLRVGGHYSEINNYSWDLENYTKTSKLVLNAFGVNATLTIKFQ